MEKVRIEADLPAALAAQARAFVAEGCATDLDDLLAEALRRFLESHAHDLTAAFMKLDRPQNDTLTLGYSRKRSE